MGEAAGGRGEKLPPARRAGDGRLLGGRYFADPQIRLKAKEQGAGGPVHPPPAGRSILFQLVRSPAFRSDPLEDLHVASPLCSRPRRARRYFRPPKLPPGDRHLRPRDRAVMFFPQKREDFGEAGGRDGRAPAAGATAGRSGRLRRLPTGVAAVAAAMGSGGGRGAHTRSVPRRWLYYMKVAANPVE